MLHSLVSASTIIRDLKASSICRKKQARIGQAKCPQFLRPKKVELIVGCGFVLVKQFHLNVGGLFLMASLLKIWSRLIKLSMVEHTVVIIHFVVIKSKWVRGGGRLEGTNFFKT